jgi:glycosyltransferase involved in cell wall biosynthesis
MQNTKKEKLVTIGMPIYNRPDSLKIALDSILAQTYQNLEIIISDNCSTQSNVEKIVKEMMVHDKRIKYYRQDKNIGPELNFRFVLERAEGEYFMWAADDDVRNKNCVESYLLNIGNSGGVFSNYLIRDSFYRTDVKIKIPDLSGNSRSSEEILKYMSLPCPSMIYGLYRTDVAKEVMPKKLFDFWDFYFCITVINKYGIKTFEGEPLYIAGINQGYKLHPFDGKKFKYAEYIIRTMPAIIKCGYKGIIKHLKFIKWVYILNSKMKLTGRLE